MVTGQAALLANQEEGVVVGDRVNTAARVQAAADPGTVLVDDITRQITSTAVAYEDAGHHELKGKAEPVHLWRALEVLVGPGESGPEAFHARFVGRDADLRLIKELFRAGVSRRSARLVAVSGPAGVGKSRLRGEVLEYLMQLPDRYLWHPGRCLPYGDGVAYWALAEMVRHRLGISEDAPASDAAAKLQAGLERWVEDPAERAFISLRLGVLLGVAEAWAEPRGVVRRVAHVLRTPVSARPGGDGVRGHALGRRRPARLRRVPAGLVGIGAHLHPDLRPPRARRTTAGLVGGASQRDRDGHLEPLGEKAMEDLLDSVATLPVVAKRRIVSHAEGIPLYAIETIRALADRGALVERDGALVLAGELGELDVPPSLISLLGARLDALAPDERELVKTMSVFGGRFPLAAAQALSGLPAHAADAVLARLVRKQVLTVRADPHSPDRGQYRFAQTLLRTVAYDTLSKRERKARHLAAGQYLSRAFANEGEDIAEVVAAHYLQAYRCAAGGDDAEQLRAEAVAALRRGAQRAAAVGAPQTAERAYRRAIELAGGEEERIELTESAGDMALVDGRYEAALELFEDAAARLRQLGREGDAARLGPRIGRALFRGGRASEAIEHLQRALADLGPDTEDADVARINVRLGIALLDTGRVREALDPLDRALELAQALDLPGELASALAYKAQLCVAVGRAYEAQLLFDGAAELCRQHELTNQLVSVELNSGDFLWRFDLPGSAERARAALDTARRVGNRYDESIAAANLMGVWADAGEWDELQRLGTELLANTDERPGAEILRFQLGLVAAFRGQIEVAREQLARMVAWGASQNNQLRWLYAACEATVAVAAGEFAAALEVVDAAIEEIVQADGPSSQANRIAFPAAIGAAVSLGRLGDAESLLSLLAERPPGHIPPYLRAQVSRGYGLVASARGEVGAAESNFAAAIEAFGSLGCPYWRAVAQTDLADALVSDARPAEATPLLNEAQTVFIRLGAAPALERAEALLADDGSVHVGRDR